MTPPINVFMGEHYFLSNFSDEGGVKPTVEHWYQAGKTDDPFQRDGILNAQTPGAAKRLGRRCTLVPNWEEFKDEWMLALLQTKFEDAAVRAKLLATGEAELVEGNTWGDTYWGACEDGDGILTGKNMLGQLLMQVREECRG